MNKQSYYNIPFAGLKEGKHLFYFKVDENFFTNFEQHEFENGNIIVNVELEKRATYLSLQFHIEGKIELICDRCLDTYWQHIDSNNTLLVKFSEQEIEDDAEIIYIQPTEHQIEVSQFIYEYIVLSLPIRRVHSNNNDSNSLCNPEMLKKLEEYKITETKNEEVIDPRWSELKKIISN